MEANAVAQPMHSYIGPPFADAKVYDAMRVGLVTCRPETSVEDVGRMMLGYGIHAVVVSEVGAQIHPQGIVTALDLAAAAADQSGATAGEIASTELVTIASNEPLQHAAGLMAKYGISHLIVTSPGSEQAVGMISARTIAAAIAYSGV